MTLRRVPIPVIKTAVPLVGQIQDCLEHDMDRAGLSCTLLRYTPSMVETVCPVPTSRKARMPGARMKSRKVGSTVRAFIRYAAKRAGRRRGHGLLAFGHGRHRDHDFSSGVFVYHVPERFSRLAQRVGLIDDGYDLARFKELSEHK
jgi:hypothetical protein